MINLLTEEKIRKLIVQGRPDKAIAKVASVTCTTVKKIRRVLTLVGHIDDQLKEQIIAKLCAGYAQREIADITKTDVKIVSAVGRFCYLRSKRKMARMPAVLCSVCKADIDALNDEPCFKTYAATNGCIEHEARAMFKVVCDTVGLDGLCIVASPIFGAIAREAGQIKNRVLGEESNEKETETK